MRGQEDRVDVECGAVVTPGSLQEKLRARVQVGETGWGLQGASIIQSIFCKVEKP